MAKLVDAPHSKCGGFGHGGSSPPLPIKFVMLQDIIEVQTRENYQLYLKFEDGNAGIIDVSEVIDFIGIFEPLKDLDYFKTVKLNPEWGTIYWEHGEDLDPDVLYSVITGQSIPNFQIQKSIK